MRVLAVGFGLILLALGGSAMKSLGAEVRKPAVAGMFYPGNPDELKEALDRLLAAAKKIEITEPLVALVSPHAGYQYSGHVAAHAYSLLRGRDIKRVIVISPCHVEAFSGAAVYDGEGYATPLGVIPVDVEFCRALASSSPRIKYSNRGHRKGPQGRGEHALEVQLPFLQRVIDDFQLVPIVMGDQSLDTCRALAMALAKVMDSPETVIVASSDLSHFHTYDKAVELDRKVLDTVEKWDYLRLSRNLELRVWEACGGGPIVAAMMVAERMGATEARILKYANSGDVAYGEKGSVVGYAAVSFSGSGKESGVELDAIELDPGEEEELIGISRESVQKAVAGIEMEWDATNASASLLKKAAVFVTIKKRGQLRGCVGSIVPVQSLGAAVASAARSAAMKDPRFTPVEERELAELRFEISVLSPFRRINDVRQVMVGKHGLWIERGRRQGLLLPQVATDYSWDRVTFLEQTCLKAGLENDAWKDDDTEIYVFSATVFGEPDN